MNVEIRNEAAQFLVGKYINRIFFSVQKTSKKEVGQVHQLLYIKTHNFKWSITRHFFGQGSPAHLGWNYSEVWLGRAGAHSAFFE
jgi:hypothetical protein